MSVQHLTQAGFLTVMSPRLRVQGEIASCTGQHANLSETKLCLDRSEKELEQIQCHLVNVVW